MARAGLTTERVVAAAASLVDRHGVSSLTLSRLAEDLSVRPPSLYNHIDGLEALIRAVAISGVSELAEVCRDATMGLAGSDALRSVATAYRSWAKSHPGTYPLTQVAHPGDDEWTAASRRLLAPVIAALAGYGLHGDDAIHAIRMVRSALHGFVMLEIGHGFGLTLDVEVSFDRLLDAVDRGLGSSGFSSQ